MRRLVYYIATSVDGFIADPDGDVSRFPVIPETLAALLAVYPETCPTHLRGPLGVTASPQRFDTVVMGRATYAPALQAGLPGGAYPHLRQVVAAHDALDAPGIETISGDLVGRVSDLKAEAGDDIWLCGGADLAGQLVDLVDELQIKINPVLLGEGIPLFRGVGPRSLEPVASETLPGGVVLATYRVGGQRR